MLVSIDPTDLKTLLDALRSEAGEEAVKITSRAVNIGEGIEAHVVWLPAYQEPGYNPEFDK